MARCAGVKANGERCTLPATAGSRWCWAHSPQHSEQRRKMASRAARSNRKNQPTREVQSAKRALLDLAEDVLAGRVERDLATAAAMVYNTALRALEVERRWREADEIAVRLQALEEIAGKGQTWRG